MKCTQSILAAMVALSAGVSAAATHKMYRLYATEPHGSQRLNVDMFHAGASSANASLLDPALGDGSLFYFEGGSLFSPVAAHLPDYGIDFGDDGDGVGGPSIIRGNFGLRGRDDWELDADGRLHVPSKVAGNAFYECIEDHNSFPRTLVGYGRPNADGSLPDRCFSTVELFATPA